MDKPLKAVTRGQCDARPTVTFPAAGHHRRLTGTKLYWLLTEARVREQLAQGPYPKAEQPGVESATFWVASPEPSPSHHHATRQTSQSELYLDVIGCRRGVVVSGVRRMNEVNPRRAQLVPGWVTVFGRVYHLGM